MKYEVDLLNFRRVNDLTQSVLAGAINVTNGYISLIERGKSGLSSDKVSLLLQIATANKWDTRPLFPSCWRLAQLNDYAQKQGWKDVIQKSPIITTNDGIHTIESWRENEEYCVSLEDWGKYKNGTLTISENFAHLVCQRYPRVNFVWIYNGEESMLKEQVDVERESLEDYMKKIDQKLDLILSVLQGEKILQKK